MRCGASAPVPIISSRARVGPRQIARGEAGGAGGAPLGQHGAVEQRQGLRRCCRRAAGTGRRSRAAPRVPLSGKTVTSLTPTRLRRRPRPGRHQQQRGVGRTGPAGRRSCDDGAAASRSRRGTARRGDRSAPGRRGRHRPRRPTGSSSLEGLRGPATQFGRDQRALALDRLLVARRRGWPAAGARPGGRERCAQARRSRGRAAPPRCPPRARGGGDGGAAHQPSRARPARPAAAATTTSR